MRRTAARVAAAVALAACWWGVRAGAGIPELDEPVPAAPAPAPKGQPRTDPLVAGLADPARSKATLDGILARPDAEEVLVRIARANVDVAARGWAVSGMARLPTPPSALSALATDGEAPMLVRTWAMAAMVSVAPDMRALSALSQQQYAYPGLDRPVRIRAGQLLAGAPLTELLAASADGTMQPMVTPLVMAADEAELVRLVYAADDDTVRRQAAAYAASRGQQPDARIGALVLERLAFRRGSVPWAGGALYVPAVSWTGAQGKELLHTLMAWSLYTRADPNLASEAQQVWNNLYSYQLLTANGYDMNLQPETLLDAVERVEGAGAAKELRNRVGSAGAAMEHVDGRGR